MISPSGKQTAKTTAQTLEWQVCEDEREWQNTQSQFVAPLSAEMQTQHWVSRALQRWGAPAVCFLLSLALLGGWLWQRAQVGLAEVESEVEGEIVAELWSEPESYAPAQAAEESLLKSVELPNDPGEIVTQVEILDLGRDWAVVEVVMQPMTNGQSYRQTRVYHDGVRGWMRGGVAAARWGVPRQLESDYFVFHYHALDEAAVKYAAAQLDSLYPALYVSIVGDLPSGERRTIIIDPEKLPESQLDQSEGDLVVASPAATLMPAELAGGDFLLQSLVITLYDRLSIEAFTRDNLPGRWSRLHNALRLWFIWDRDLPLAVWRKPLMKWILDVPEEGARRGVFDVPPFAQELCFHHSLWMRSPLAVAVPIHCWQSDADEEKITAWPYHYMAAELSLGTLIYSPPASMDEFGFWRDVPLPEPGPYDILLATVFEYVASTYGSGMMPLLLAAIPKHERAETLIPAVFGVPLAEFTEGWHAFLAERYEIAP